MEKNKTEKLYVGSNSAKIGYQYFINFCEGGNLFLYCPMIRVLTIVQMRDLHVHVLGYKGLPYFCL